MDEEALEDAMIRGIELTEDEVVALEDHVALVPDDIGARFTLIGRYSRPPKRFAPLAVHLCALIGLDPKPHLLELPFITRLEDEIAYGTIEAAWLRAVEGACDTRALFNAHRVIATSSSEQGERLLLRGLADAPQDLRWQRAACEFYFFHGVGKGDRTFVERAMEAGKRVMDLSVSDLQRAAALPLVIPVALAAHDFVFARSLAEEAVLVKIFGPTAAPYHGHLALGLLAHDAADLASAESHLRASATCIDGFSFEVRLPPLQLAQALWTSGRRDTVREFASELQRRKPSGADKVQAWLRALEKG
jgi:hypothetical protein